MDNLTSAVVGLEYKISPRIQGNRAWENVYKMKSIFLQDNKNRRQTRIQIHTQTQHDFFDSYTNHYQMYHARRKTCILLHSMSHRYLLQPQWVPFTMIFLLLKFSQQ